MLKGGIIGLGKMGVSHYSILNTHPEVEVVAVCDTSNFVLGCLSKLTSISLFNDYKKMLDECQLDCVVIATPTSSHMKIVSDCLNKGLHVFVEKPFCLKLDDGRRMIDLAVSKKRVNQVGFHNKFIGAFRKVKEFIDNGIIGDIYHLHGSAYGPVVLKSKGSTWRAKKSEGGGCLHDYASHVIDLMNYYVGAPKKVSGTVLKRIFSKDVEDAVYSTLLYNNGLTGQLSVNWSEETYRKMSTMVTIYGTNGKIIVDRQECKIYLKKAIPSCKLEKGWNVLYTTELTPPVWFYLRGEEYSAQMDYFVGCITGNKLDNINSFASALTTDMVIDMLMKDA
ncbi:MAG: Gfo/Idh/MocA family oxidoreductase [Sedimentisphaerales bacterium]|nr:Gfo/Idh/MocA family oxidoreductase [Sedimentisphaerales bacterium]